MKLVFYVNRHRIPIPFPDWLLLNTITLHKISQMPGFHTWQLSLSKEQLRKIRKSLQKMRKMHGHLCLFDLDDGIGMELGEKVQLYL